MELITERGRLDTYDTFTWSLNYKSAEILDLKGRKASFSKSIKIPYTARNRAIFEGLDEFNVDNVGYDTKSVLQCFISHQGRVLMSGTLTVLEFSKTKEEEEVQVQLISYVKNLITKLKKVQLNSLDFAEWTHPYTSGDIYNNVIWNTCQLDDVLIPCELGQGYTYALVDYGKDDSVSETQWGIKDLRPCLYLKEYIDAIFRFAGLTYTSQFFESQYWRSLVLLNTVDVIKLTDEQKAVYSADITMNTDFKTALDDWCFIGSVQTGWDSIYTQNEAYYLPFDIENDPLNQWQTALPQPAPNTLNGGPSTGNVFTCQKTGTYTFKLQMTFEHQYQIYWQADIGFAILFQSIPVGQVLTGYPSPFPYVVEHKVEIIKNGAVFTFEEYFDQTPIEYDVEGWYTGTGSCGTAYWNGTGVKTDVREITLDLQVGDYIAFRTFEPQKSFATQYGYILHRWDFEEISLSVTLDEAESEPGDDITFLNYIPTIQADSFIDGIFNLFNLWVIDNPFKPDDLIIEPRTNFFDSGGYIDMSDKLDWSSTIKSDYLADKLPRVFQYRFSKSEDVNNTLYDSLNDLGYADRDSFVDVEFTDKKQTIQTLFSPMITQLKNGLYYPQEFKIDDSLNKQGIGQFLKLGFVERQVDGDWELEDGFGGIINVDKYIRVSEFDNVLDPTYTLTFDDPQPFINFPGTPDWNLFNLFHELTEFEQTRNGAKMITAKFNLNENDIAELDLRRAWFVNGVYYRLIEIKDYNPLSNGTTSVTLLQIESPRYDYTTNDVIYKNGLKTIQQRVLGENTNKAVTTNIKNNVRTD